MWRERKVAYYTHSEFMQMITQKNKPKKEIIIKKKEAKKKDAR